MPVVYGDLYKPFKDFLTKFYCGNQHKLEIKTKDSITFNPVFTREADGKVGGTVTVEGAYDPCKWCHLVLKYGINTKGVLTTKATLDRMKWAGLKVEGNAEIAIGDDVKKDVYDVKAEYKTRQSTYVCNLKQNNDGLTAEASAVFAYQALNVGAQATLDLNKNTVKGTSVGGTYDVSKATTVVALLENMQKLKTGYLTTSGEWKFGLEYSADTTDIAKGTITVGTERKLSGGQVFKGKVDTQGTVAASLQHKLSPELKLTSSLEVDTSKGWTSRFGTQLIYEA